jgi:hypothetical protein
MPKYREEMNPALVAQLERDVSRKQRDSLRPIDRASEDYVAAARNVVRYLFYGYMVRNPSGIRSQVLKQPLVPRFGIFEVDSRFRCKLLIADFSFREEAEAKLREIVSGATTSAEGVRRLSSRP